MPLAVGGVSLIVEGQSGRASVALGAGRSIFDLLGFA